MSFKSDICECDKARHWERAAFKASNALAEEHSRLMDVERKNETLKAALAEGVDIVQRMIRADMALQEADVDDQPQGEPELFGALVSAHSDLEDWATKYAPEPA